MESIIMRAKIDWISISVQHRRIITQNDLGKWIVAEGIDGRDKKIAKYMLMYPGEFQTGKGRGVFTRSIMSPREGWSYFWTDNKPYSLLEITGRGCDRLSESNAILNMIDAYSDRLTRIDIAVDIETGIQPSEFISLRGDNKFKTDGHIKSDTGETYYVGNRKSDRWARVYRYNEPHPRAHLLRVEMVCKDVWAKACGRAVIDEGIDAVSRYLGDVFAWQSPLWEFSEDTDSASVETESISHQGGTERWLITQVIAAIDKLNSKGGEKAIMYFLNQVKANTGLSAD